MSASKKLIQASAGVGGGDFYPYAVDNSCRFDGGVNPLTRTLGSGGSSSIMCLSLWMKPNATASTNDTLMTTLNIGTNTDCRIYYNQATYPFKIRLQSYDSAVYGGENRTTAVYRDPSAWYHVFIKHDRTEASSADRGQIWIDGVRQDVTVMQTFLSSGDIGWFRNAAATHALLSYFNGYVAEVALIDGTAYDATDFGQDKDGVWMPKDISGLTFGGQGAYLNFQDGTSATTLGYDVSGNANHYTPSGIATTDQMTDTPTNNFPTLNPLFTYTTSPVAYSEGNLKAGNTSGSWRNAVSTIACPLTGKWYWEVSPSAVGSNMIQLGYLDNGLFGHGQVNWYSWYQTGSFYVSGSVTDTLATYTSGDIISIAYDADAGTVAFRKNNSLAVTKTSLSSGTYVPAIQTADSNVTSINFGQNGSFNGAKTAQGNADENGIGDFYYAPPSGYLALPSANLPEPTIGPNSDILPSDAFRAITYSGNSTALASGGNEFDLGWDLTTDDALLLIKCRTTGHSWIAVDTVRGGTKYLYPDGYSAEGTQAELCEFTSTGFKLGNWSPVNNTGDDYVVYCIKVTPGFFDIVVSNGTGVARNIAHSLGVSPGCILGKGVGPTNWNCYHQHLASATYILYLDAANAQTSSSTTWDSTDPDASNFRVGTSVGVNNSGVDAVFYLFADIEGFCKTGYYKGNGSADGSFEYLGFSPEFSIIKCINLGYNWTSRDTKINPYNPADTHFLVDWNNAEATTSTYAVDFVSNGAKVRGVDASINGNGSSYITLSIGGNSIKYSNAR
jgi:hypothetical protein